MRRGGKKRKKRTETREHTGEKRGRKCGWAQLCQIPDPSVRAAES